MGKLKVGDKVCYFIDFLKLCAKSDINEYINAKAEAKKAWTYGYMELDFIKDLFYHYANELDDPKPPHHKKTLFLAQEVRAIIDLFCEKHDLQFEFIGGLDAAPDIVACSDYFFSMSDIVLDIESEAPKDEIIRWYDYIQENKNDKCNYRSWLIGYDKIPKK